MHKKLLFILNPIAGKAKIKNKLCDIVDLFIKHEYEVNIHTTQAKEDAYNTIKKQVDQYDLVVCCGGDGTLNEAIRAFLAHPTKAKLAYIPCGTTNDFATTLKLSKSPLTCAKQIMKGKEIPIDVGSINGIGFAYITAFGVFSDVSYTTPQISKNIFGHGAYVLESMKQFMNMPQYQLKIIHDTEAIQDEFCYGMITNSMSVGGMHFFDEKNVEINDGYFECLFIKRPNNPLDLQQLLSAFLTKDVTKCSRMYAFKAKEITIECNKSLAFNVDGEFADSFTHCHIKNHHNALTIIK